MSIDRLVAWARQAGELYPGMQVDISEAEQLVSEIAEVNVEQAGVVGDAVDRKWNLPSEARDGSGKPVPVGKVTPHNYDDGSEAGESEAMIERARRAREQEIDASGSRGTVE